LRRSPGSILGYEMGPIRPPSEAASLLIRVSRNCPWNHCTFCPVYKGQAFEARDPAEVEADVLAARRLQGDVFTSAFLQDADSLVLPAPALAGIIRLIRSSFPRIERVTTYGRATTLFRCSLEDLVRLREAGLSRVHVGLESGSKRVLQRVRKGISPRIQVEAGWRVRDAGLELCEYVMPGLGGVELSTEHAVETAAVLRQIEPDFIRLRTLCVQPGSPLDDDHRNGRFTPLAEDQTVAEIRLLIDGLDGVRGRLTSDHALNLLGEIEGQLPGDRPRLLAIIDRYLALDPRDRLRFRLGRRLGVVSRLDQLELPPIRERLGATLARFEELDPGGAEAAISGLMRRCL